MAISAEEKERRKLATNARNRAFSARWRERYKAEQAGQQKIAAAFHDEETAASQAEDALLAERAEIVKKIDDQIAELQRQKDAAVSEIMSRFSKARAVSSAINDRKREADKALQAELNEQFPDMVHRPYGISAAVWKPIEEFLP